MLFRSIVTWVAVSQLFQGVYTILSIGPLIANRGRYLVWAAVTAAVGNCVLNVILIPSLGITGAAIATLVGYALLAVFVYFAGQRSFPIQADWARLGKLSLVSVLVAGVLFGAEHLHPLAMELALKGVGLLLFPVLLIAAGFVSMAQIHTMWSSGVQNLAKRLAPARRLDP